MGGEGAKSYDSEKTWSSINHSILSELIRLTVRRLTEKKREVAEGGGGG